MRVNMYVKRADLKMALDIRAFLDTSVFIYF